MRKCVLIPLVLVLFGCGDSSTGPGTDLSGLWQFSGTFSNASLQVSCNATGTANLTQSGNNLSGTAVQQGSCNGPGGTIDNSGSGNITGGQLNGTSVSFQWDECSYTGTVSGDPANRMSGNTTCTIAVLGQDYTFTGQWQASR